MCDDDVDLIDKFVLIDRSNESHAITSIKKSIRHHKQLIQSAEDACESDRSFRSIVRQLLTDHCRHGELRKYVDGELGKVKYSLATFRAYVTKLNHLSKLHARVYQKESDSGRDFAKILKATWPAELSHAILASVHKSASAEGSVVNLDDDYQVHGMLSDFGWERLRPIVEKESAMFKQSGKSIEPAKTPPTSKPSTPGASGRLNDPEYLRIVADYEAVQKLCETLPCAGVTWKTDKTAERDKILKMGKAHVNYLSRDGKPYVVLQFSDSKEHDKVIKDVKASGHADIWIWRKNNASHPRNVKYR